MLFLWLTFFCRFVGESGNLQFSWHISKYQHSKETFPFQAYHKLYYRLPLQTTKNVSNFHIFIEILYFSAVNVCHETVSFKICQSFARQCVSERQKKKTRRIICPMKFYPVIKFVFVIKKYTHRHIYVWTIEEDSYSAQKVAVIYMVIKTNREHKKNGKEYTWLLSTYSELK